MSEFRGQLPKYGVIVLVALAGITSAVFSGEGRSVAHDGTSGRLAFETSCATCHGFDGEGLPGLGISLIDNPAVTERTQGQLIQFLKEGRQADDPLSITRREMPPRGGDTSLSDADLRTIAAFLQARLFPDSNGRNTRSSTSTRP